MKFVGIWTSLFVIYTAPASAFSIAKEEPDTFILSHVIFRHGDRAPDMDELEKYKTDPYRDYDFYPLGRGELTNDGKLREYAIGTSLRKRYDKFLGDDYHPAIVEARTTDVNRTKMSVGLVLAGLFPPRGKQIWHKEKLNWQPVPYTYWPKDKDKELRGDLCPKYKEEMEKLIRSEEYQLQIRKYNDTLSYLSENVGSKIETFNDVWNLYFGLAAEQELGLQLPNWTEWVYPDLMREMAIHEYHVFTYNDLLTRVGTGYLFKKILEDTKTKINDEANEHGKKIYLYSGHEHNIAQVLRFLGIFQSHVPDYGSYIMIEIHRINSTYGVKVFYQDYSSDTPHLVRLPACRDFCPLEKFVQLYGHLIPEDDSECYS